MRTPLHAGWTISGDALPERFAPEARPVPAFTLPGAAALSDFADLLGGAPETPEEPQENTGAPFQLPALIPGDAPGEVTLSREIDFGEAAGRRAYLTFDLLSGCGEAELVGCPPRYPRPGTPEPEPLCIRSAFADGPLTLDVTPALAARRRCRLTLRFSEKRPAGACGPIALRTVGDAMLETVSLSPGPDSLTLRARVAALAAGDFVLRAQLCPAVASERPEDAPPAREVTLRLAEGEARDVALSMQAALPPFLPGKAYAAPSLKLQLARRFPAARSGAVRETPCDGATLPCGMPGPAPRFWLPLAAQDALCPPDALMERLRDMHVHAVSLPAAAPDIFYRALTREGVAVRQTLAIPREELARLRRYPCVSMDGEISTAFADSVDKSAVLSAWRLGGLITYPRPADPDLTEADMLAEIAGREVNPEHAQDVLAWLRVLSVRLRAEAIRQGKLSGALCTPGAWRDPEIAQALGAALAPLHLSALPLCGAWWTGAHFSASLQAFIPEPGFGAPLRAEAVLENAQGEALARAAFPCPAKGGVLGVMEAALPDAPCALELVTRLYAGNRVVEQSALPVYVGARGALEAAFEAT